jgi:hypothetical protein
MRGRAEAAASELLRLATTLDIRGLDRITVFYRALVESQWHGLELFPSAVVDEIEANRAQFLKKFFNLPSSTATNLTIVLFDLWPANYDAMSRRISFAEKMRNHDLNFVRDAFLFDRTLMRTKEGWHHQSFLIFQSMFRNKTAAEFSMDRASSRLSPISRSRTQFLFHLLRVTDEVTLAPFRLFETVEIMVSFCELIGSISKSTADLLLLFCSSGHRFRFFEYVALKCPLCSCSSWLFNHLFTCAVTEPLLARNGIFWADFETNMGKGKWREVLFLLHEVLTVWKNSFTTCTIDDVTMTLLYDDACKL